MTKIKNYRIHLRVREIARWMKHQFGVAASPELEAAIEQLIAESKTWLQPAAVYTTLTKTTAERATALPLPKEAVSASVIAVTIGTRVEEERSKAETAQLEDRARLLAGLQQEALFQSIQFAVRLLQDQAKEEECDMSVPVPVTENPLLAPLAALLGVGRIGLEVSGETPQLPPHARMAWTHWTPTRKGAKRQDSSAKAAKAAV